MENVSVNQPAIKWTPRTVSVSELNPFEKNPRKITPEDFENLKRSITEDGYHQRIIATPDLRVIGGHQRIKALTELGIKEIEILVADREISDEQFKRILVRDNLEYGTWEIDALADIMPAGELIELGIDEDILPTPVVVGLTGDDEVPEPPAAPISSPGDVWLCGAHRVMCGDATKLDDFKELMGSVKPDMVVTDPPYGVSIVNVGTKRVGGGGETKFSGKKGKVGGGKIVDAREYSPIIGDDTTETARKFYHTCLAFGLENYIIFGGNYFTDFLPPRACWLVWDKENTGNFAAVELAWTSMPTAAKLYKHLWNGLSRKGDRKTELTTRVHPTQKPVGLFEQIFADFKFKRCFDGFLGSGSTLIACEKTGRACYGMEMSPDYCDVIVQRWQAFSGGIARLESTGEMFNDIMKHDRK